MEMAVSEDGVPCDRSMEFVAEYTTKDLILYALAIGFGSSEEEISYVFEKHSSFSAVPSFSLVLPFWADKSLGNSQTIKPFPPPMIKAVGLLPTDHVRTKSVPKNLPVIHTSQSITWHRPVPIPTEGSAIQTHLMSRIISVVPKSVGTFVTSETHIKLNESVICNMQSTNLLLGMPPEDVIPFGTQPNKRQRNSLLMSKSPVFEWAYSTIPIQALLYRMASGDSNIIHVDSSSVSLGGDPKRPLLHGLCTLGIAVRGIMKYLRVTGGGFQFKRLDVVFTKPVFVGDVLMIRIWEDATREVHINDTRLVFQVLNSDSGDLVIDHGIVCIDQTGMTRARL
jgi:acyl dehydratase